MHCTALPERPWAVLMVTICGCGAPGSSIRPRPPSVLAIQSLPERSTYRSLMSPDPEPAGAVDIQVIDVARRQPVGLREKFKAAVAIASQPAIEADPEGALAVLAKDLSQAVRNRGMIAERAGRPHPLAEAIAGAAVRGGGKPDIAGGVLEQAEHVVRYQPVPRIVKRLRGGASQLFDACDLGEAQQPGAGGNPPFTRAILKRRLVPTPAEVMDGGGKLGLRRPKALAIQPVDPQPMEFLAQDTEVSRQVL